MNPRTIARVLLVVIVVFGAIGLGVAAYNAGVTQGVAQTAAQAGNVVVAPGAYPVVPYAGYGWGWGWGFGHLFFGFFGFLIFLFLFFGLLRLAFGGGRGGWGRHGYYGRGPRNWTDGEGRSWEDRAREAHDAWHRDHPDTPGSPTTGGQAG